MSSLFDQLSKTDVGEHIEKKGKFSYISWAWAWQELKKLAPDATFEKHRFHQDELTVPYMRDENGETYVMVSVTAGGETHTEVFPVLNHQNKSIRDPNSFEVNTALQRCLVKAIAYHGLGLYIYAGEDLPAAPSKEDLVEEHSEVLDRIKGLLDKGSEVDLLTAYEIWHGLDEGTRNALHSGAPNNKRNPGPLGVKHKEALKTAERAYTEACGAMYEQLMECQDKDQAIKDMTDMELKVVCGLMTNPDKSELWTSVTNETQQRIKEATSG